MSCSTCKFYKPEMCVSECLQIHFKNYPSLQNLPSVRIHKSEVAYVKIGSRFLLVVDTDGTQHSYNIDNITHFHIPDLNKK